VETVYNRYIGNTGRVVRVYDTPRRETPPERADAAASRSAASRGGGRRDNDRRGGVMGLLGGLLPRGLEAGDIVLMLLFLFLFLESGDEEFLIILAILVLGALKTPILGALK
jgi:hypothetical protein